MVNETINATINVSQQAVEVMDCFWKWDYTTWICYFTDKAQSMNYKYFSAIVGFIIVILGIRFLYQAVK